MCVCYWRGRGRDTQCLTFQFLWVTSFLQRRDIQLTFKSSSLCQCCCGDGRAFELTTSRTDEKPRVREQRDSPVVTDASKAELGLEPRCLSGNCPAMMSPWAVKTTGLKMGVGEAGG